MSGQWSCSRSISNSTRRAWRFGWTNNIGNRNEHAVLREGFLPFRRAAFSMSWGLSWLPHPQRSRLGVEIGGPVDIGALGQQLPAPSQVTQALQGRGQYRSAAPRHVGESRGVDAAQADQPIAAVPCRTQHGIAAMAQLSDGGLQISAGERGTVTANDDHVLRALQSNVAGEGHAFTEIGAALHRKYDCELRAQLGEAGMVRGRAAP